MADQFRTDMVPLGLQGLNLTDPPDLLDPTQATKLHNVVKVKDGGLTGRPGLTTFQTLSPATAAAIVALCRLQQEQVDGGDVGRFVVHAANGAIYAGGTPDLGGSLVQVPGIALDGSIPATMAVARPPLSAESWVYLGHPAGNWRVNSTSKYGRVGLGASSVPDGTLRIDEFDLYPTTFDSWDTDDLTAWACLEFTNNQDPTSALVTLDTSSTRTVDDFEAAGWTNTAGTGGAPTNVLDVGTVKVGTASVKFTTNPGAAVGAYYNVWGKAVSLDLTRFSDGRLSSPEDHLHLWARLARPDLLGELRIYFVVSNDFDATVEPGKSATANTQAYVKAFRPSDFTRFFELSEQALAAAQAYNSNVQTLTDLAEYIMSRGGVPVPRVEDPNTGGWNSFLAGRAQWLEFGCVGAPLQLSSFFRLGTDEAVGWGTVKGIIIIAGVNTNQATDFWLDDMYTFGGAGLDSSQVGYAPYDYRFVNYHLDTGDISNPSNEQPLLYRVDAIRRAVRLQPAPYGDSRVRQVFFRRGGRIVDDWHRCGDDVDLGRNGSDGGAYVDRLSDAEIASNSSLELDNDQPCTTLDRTGKVVKAAPLAAIFGPVADLLFGCGDAYRPNILYWSKPGNYGSWPARNAWEVCAPEEVLLGGGVYNGSAFVVSRYRLYPILINLSASGSVQTAFQGCTHGALSLTAFCVGPGGIYLASDDGIYVTQGGPETNISDARLRPLWFGQDTPWYKAIDFTRVDEIRLWVHENDLFFRYADNTGAIHHLVYSLVQQPAGWRSYDFRVQTVGAWPDRTMAKGAGSGRALYLGGEGAVLWHSGATDLGKAIPGEVRGPLADQGQPGNQKQYGDLSLDLDTRGVDCIAVVALDQEGSDYTVNITGAAGGRQRYTLDPWPGGLNTSPVEGYRAQVAIRWGSSSATPPIFYKAGLSYLIQPDTIVKRVTDWDDCGRLSDKYFKGCLLYCDTGGAVKELVAETDTGEQTTFKVQTADRHQVIEVAWQQIAGRLIRLRGTDAVEWQLHELRWVFDEEPVRFTRWETQEVNHGITGWHTVHYGYITIRSTADVYLTIDAYNRSGNVRSATYTLPSTAGVKRTLFLSFEAMRGVLHKYTFWQPAPGIPVPATSDTGFFLYRPESSVLVSAWGGDMAEVRPFGDDDLDGVRGLRDAGASAVRGGGGE